MIPPAISSLRPSAFCATAVIHPNPYRGRRKTGFAASVQDEPTFATELAPEFKLVEKGPAALVTVKAGGASATGCEKSIIA